MIERYFKYIKKVLIAIAFLLFIALHSCKYDTHDIYERNLNQNVTEPTIETVHLDLSENEDTVELAYNRVHFNFKSSDQQVSGVKFYLDGTLIGTVESGNSSFDLYHEFLFLGMHRLKLEIFTHSGTGSIADSLGMEGFLFASKEWTIKVQNTTYSGVTSIVSDGFLKLVWAKPDQDITEFIIYRSNQEIGRTATCEYVDKGYVGEGANYSVAFKSTYNAGQLETLGWVNIPNEIRLKKFNYNTRNNYNILWERPKYYAAVKSIQLVRDNDDYSTSQLEMTTDINQNSFVIPTSLFGQLAEFRLILSSKSSKPMYNNPSYPSNSSFSSPKIKCMIGYPSPIFDSFSRISSTEFLYHTDMYDYESTAYNDSMFRYSTTQNKVLESFRYNPPNYGWSGDHYWNPTASSDGSYFVANVGLSGTAIVSSAYNLKDYKIFDISSLTSSTLKIPVSNNGRGIVIGSDKKYLYDFINKGVLATVNSTTWLDDHNISSDGNYFFLRVSHTVWLYSFLNNQLKLERTISADNSPGYDYFNFMASEPDKAVSWNKNTKAFSILRCSDLGILKSFTIDANQILDIDYYHNRILTFSPKRLMVYSLTDGSVLYDIPVSFEYMGTNRCHLTGNSIFHEKGARYFLN